MQWPCQLPAQCRKCWGTSISSYEATHSERFGISKTRNTDNRSSDFSCDACLLIRGRKGSGGQKGFETPAAKEKPLNRCLPWNGPQWLNSLLNRMIFGKVPRLNSGLRRPIHHGNLKAQVQQTTWTSRTFVSRKFRPRPAISAWNY